MSRSRRAAAEDLRRAVDCLPLRTRQAMLEGIREHDIIAGAYADRRGGVCPMLAAHRHGGRTSFITFARTWDRFTGARRARLASERELRVLRAHLEASILAEQARGDLGAAIADHRRLVVDRAIREEHAPPAPEQPGVVVADVPAAPAPLARP
ncbi:MAG TPA: hypothetical protein VLB47_01130 [Solirubrobacteraceae bacterium]|nr:hypothetical protein [Solirubrobacteraceae bacterium]